MPLLLKWINRHYSGGCPMQIEILLFILLLTKLLVSNLHCRLLIPLFQKAKLKWINRQCSGGCSMQMDILLLILLLIKLLVSKSLLHCRLQVQTIIHLFKSLWLRPITFLGLIRAQMLIQGAITVWSHPWPCQALFSALAITLIWISLIINLVTVVWPTGT